MKRFYFVVFIASMMLLNGCTSGFGNPKSQSNITDAGSINSSTSTLKSGIVNSSIWKSFGSGQGKIVMKPGLPGILNSPKDTNATYAQINSLLAQSVVYTKAVPKDNITHPFTEAAGYLGPPELTISDKQHEIVINPAWYIDTPDAGRFAVHQIPNILEVSVDGEISYLQSSSFYNWMYNKEWQSSFQDYTMNSQ